MWLTWKFWDFFVMSSCFMMKNDHFKAPSKWENLSPCSTKLTLSKKLLLASGCRQTKYSLLVFKIHIFSILSMAFAVPFPSYFQKLQLLLLKQNWNNAWSILLPFVWAPKVCLRFQTGEINIFVFCGLFLVDIFN